MTKIEVGRVVPGKSLGIFYIKPIDESSGEELKLRLYSEYIHKECLIYFKDSPGKSKEVIDGFGVFIEWEGKDNSLYPFTPLYKNRVP